MKRNSYIFIAFVAIVIVTMVGCGIVMSGKGEHRTKWEVAYNQNNTPTKIKYSFSIESDGGMNNYRVYLYNGYEKPMRIYYKVYFVACEPYYGNQYLYTKKESFTVGMGNWEPVKVEIIQLIEQ